MNNITLYAIALIVIGAYAYWKLILQRKNTLCDVYIYRLISGKIYWDNPGKPIKGKIVIVDNVEKLKLAKRYSKIPLKAPIPDDFILNTNGKRIINILKVGEDKYIYIKDDIDVTSGLKKVKIMDNNTTAWMMNEWRATRERNKQEDKYGWIKSNIVMLAAIVLALLLVIYAMKWTGEQMDQAREANDNTVAILGAINKLQGNGYGLNSGQNNNEETEVAKPPGRDVG